MKELLGRRLLYFWLVFIPAAIAGLICIILTDKGELFLSINRQHTPWADVFFLAVTYLGNGAVFAVVAAIALVLNRANGILAAGCFLVSSLVSQLLKKLVFPDVWRPARYFEGKEILHTVAGVKPHLFHSFPSGHTITAFAMAVFLTLVLPSRKWGAVLAVLAVLVAFSRVYLVQHFAEDVYAGAWIGIISSCIVFLLLEKRLRNNPRLNRPLF